MSDAIAPPPARRGWPWLAWLVIVAAAVWIAWPHGDPAVEAAVRRQAGVESMEMQARALIGFGELSGQSSDAVLEQARAMNHGPYMQRLRFVVLAGDLGGAKKARAALRGLNKLAREQGYKPTAKEKDTEAMLRRFYGEGGGARAARLPQGGTAAREPAVRRRRLSAEEQERLRVRLGWFGDLALSQPGGPLAGERQEVLRPARRAALTLGLAAVGVILAWLGGGALLLLFLIMVVPKLRGRDPFADRWYGGIYAETFALWLLLFLGLSWVASRLPVGQWRILLGGVAMLMSLAVLAWPVLRGVPWAAVRADVGLGAGGRPWREIALGLPTYAVAIFLVVFGALAMLGLQQLETLWRGPEGPFEPPRGPTHPAADWLLHGGWPGRLGVFFAASVVAPLVEETMFRGVLYRHLREATGRWGRALSFLASAVVVSFVFAAIHPQGWLGVPPLMALALAFALAREWRGWLPAPMLAHGLHNTALLVLLLLIAG
jgi:membrane protease YdiL (CAAX protease family)